MSRQEADWFGHRTAERVVTDSVVLYRDPENQALIITLTASATADLFNGANLWEIDRFVEGLEASADPDAKLMRARLNKVRELGKQGNWAECHPHASAINEAMQRHRDVAEERHRAEAYAEIAQSRMLVETQSVSNSEASPHAAARIHRSPGRRHRLAHIIAAAKEATTQPDNYHAVWDELVRIAEQPKPPAPLIGYVDSEGVKYRSDTDKVPVKFFTKEALRKQMDPKAR